MSGCPFRAAFGGGARTAPGEGEIRDAPPAASACPFSGAKASGQDGGASTCPAGGATNAPAGAPAPPAAPAPATCPFGFGSGKAKPRLTELDCPRCRALLREPVSLACTHTFCASCLPPTAQDCLVCGADVAGRTPDAAKAAEVAARLEEEAQAAARAAGGDPLTAAAAAAGVWLAASLASSAGGNPGAGLARLGEAAEGLERALGGVASPSSPPPSPPASASAVSALAVLAAVRGSQGDCWRALGDADAAAASYGAAVAALEGGGGGRGEEAGGAPGPPSLDLLHARAVTLSKLGDLEYVRAGPAAAAALYGRALVARLGAGGEAVPAWAAEVAGGGGAGASAPPPPPPAAAGLRVDAGLSAAKVGDALAAAGQAERARAAFHLAAALAARAGEDAAAGRLEPAASGRLARLTAFLENVPAG